MGFVGVKPEKRGERAVSLTLATHRRGYTKADGSVVPETTDWHNVTVFDSKLSEFCLKYVDKGSMLVVEGEIRYSTYTDSNGIERRGTEIIAYQVSFPNLGKRKEDQAIANEPIDSDMPF